MQLQVPEASGTYFAHFESDVWLVTGFLGSLTPRVRNETCIQFKMLLFSYFTTDSHGDIYSMYNTFDLSLTAGGCRCPEPTERHPSLQSPGR